MALSFPSDPINGAVSGDYTYDASKTAWRKNAALPISVTHSDVAPSNPRAGDQWWKSNEGTLFTYYNDGTSSQWVESTNVVANVEPNPIPAGAMMAWGSNIIPANWLLCDGSAVSRSTYASLFAIIGTQYGSGDGTTTFNLPNIKGRTIVGKDAAQTEFDVLGETGGAKTHTLTEAEMPTHTHVQNAHNHTQDAHNHSQNSHYHQIITRSNVVMQHEFNGSSSVHGTRYSSAMANELATASSTATNNPATATNQATTATNQNTGGGGAHNNLQPYIVLNYIIKYSAGETPGDSQLAGMISNKANVNTANTFTGQQLAVSSTTTTVPLIARGVASQTADLQQWQDSAGAVVARVDSGGRLFTSKPVFSAYNLSSTANNAFCVYTSTNVNVGSCYSTSTGRFTAPVSGVYIFNWANINQNNTVHRYTIYKNGVVTVPEEQLRLDALASGSEYVVNATKQAILELTAGEYVQLRFQSDDGSSAYAPDVNYPRFSGYLL